MAAALLSIVLLVYSNLLTVVVARRGWDQWHAFTLGNAALGLLTLVAGWRAGLLSGAWGTTTLQGVLVGCMVGLAPLVIIVALMFSSETMGRDIVAAGIGTISPSRFIYRLLVQVTVTTVLVEEWAFRGVLYVLLGRTVPTLAVAIGALIFGLWHAMLQYVGISETRMGRRLVMAAGGTGIYALLGLLLILVRAETGGLASSIAAHGLLDLGMFCAMLLRRGSLRGTVLQDDESADSHNRIG